MLNFQKSGNLLALGTHQFVNSERIYMGFSICLKDMYLDHSNLLSKSTAKLNDVAKMLDVIPAECEKRFGVYWRTSF